MHSAISSGGNVSRVTWDMAVSDEQNAIVHLLAGRVQSFFRFFTSLRAMLSPTSYPAAW